MKNSIDELDNGIVIKDVGGNVQTVDELREVNAATRQGGNPGNRLRLELGDVVYTENGSTISALLTMSSNSILFLTDSSRSQRDSANTQNAIDQMVNFIKSRNPRDLVTLINNQISLRQRDLVRLRRLMYIQQTAIQNAVDIVQTKRIDFLREKEDTWADGVFGALFFAVVFAIFPVEAVLARLLGKLMQVITRVLGARFVAGLFNKPRINMGEQIVKLEKELEKLRVTGPISQRQQGRASRAAAALEANIRDIKAELGQSRENEKQYLDFLVIQAAEHFNKPYLKVIPKVLADKVEESIKKNITGSGEQDQQAQTKTLSGVPVDIAIKEQVQELFATLVFTAEDVIATLEVFRDSLLSQMPSDEALTALLNILVTDPSTETDKKENHANIFAEDVQQLILTATDAYEQLIWIIMYGNQVIERKKIEVITLAGDQIETLPPAPSDAHRHLLEYLHSRFYPESNSLDVGLLYESLYQAIDHRSKLGTDDKNEPVLDWNRFANPDQILLLIENVDLKPIKFEDTSSQSSP